MARGAVVQFKLGPFLDLLASHNPFVVELEMKRIIKRTLLWSLLGVGLVVGAVSLFLYPIATENPDYGDLRTETVLASRLKNVGRPRPLWNQYVLYDRLLLNFLAPLVFSGEPEYFADGATSPTFAAHLLGVELELPDFADEGLYELQANTLEGPMTPAFRVLRWVGRRHRR